MEATTAAATTSSSTTPAYTGAASSEGTTPAAYADEDARHFAVTASQVPKPTGGTGMPPPIIILPGAPPEALAKDVKSIGTRFHEDCHETDLPSPRLRSSRLFKGKGKEAVSIQQETKKPLRLLDLPVDILKDIVKEVTHTNDLTSLALCHSALHQLTIPHIYSRFDIVWPDSNTHAEPRSGVDALTYGLATLVMAEEVFGEAPWQRQQRLAGNNRFVKSGAGQATELQVRRRRGNHYAQYTRKFSLGNGPPDWVSEYSIIKEGGKMLGTLVALAVARMRSLETFIWDMPTGILRDVWIALSSLDRDDGQPCRLEKLWVRWHDNSGADPTVPPPPPPMAPSAMSAVPLQSSSAAPGALPPQIHPAALDRVEHPSLSILPPLKSLSVLDIDELAYLDEMAVLIGNSLEKLRELRVGIARQAMSREWVTVWEGEGVQQVDSDYPTAASLTIGEKRLGGVIGILSGFVYDMRRPKTVLLSKRPRRSSTSLSRDAPAVTVPGEIVQPPAPLDPETTSNVLSGITSLRDVLPDVPTNEPGQQPLWTEAEENDPLVAMSSHAASPAAPSTPYAATAPPLPTFAEHEVGEPLTPVESSKAYLSNRLQLENLELERVPLSIPVLQKAIDWTKLTSLTLLHCQNHEQLWKTLRRTYAPSPRSPTYPQPRRTSTSTPKKGSKASVAGSETDMSYALNLKKIHTNNVSPSLISFVKETLAPNSLEVLFLQEARSYSSSVTVDVIFKGALRRHRGSLKKLLIDSSEKGIDGVPTNSSRWRRWMLSREILAFIAGGKMPALRELGATLDYRDWHFFLQHLPAMAHLRSLYIPFLADHPHGNNVDARELALQIVDIVALRPEVELCYMGIANKCFEILENRRGHPVETTYLGPTTSGADAHADDDEDEDEEDDNGAEEVDDAEDDAEDEEDQTESDEEEEDDDDDDDEPDDESDADSEDGGGLSRGMARLRLREILFYDDKVAVFKARHGRL